MNEYIIKEIKNYMKNPLKYALLLEGSWGSGKTYFVQNQLTGIETTYISLNGISNLNSLSFQLAYQLLGKGLLGKNVKKDKINKGNKIVGTAGSILASYIESKINISFSELVKLLSDINLKDKLIIFDDLERCSISLEEILGFINTLVEHNQIKVLIIANEKELKQNDTYAKIKEKLIYQTFKYLPDLEELYDKLIIEENEEITKNKTFFINELKRKNHYNIRTIQFVFQRYKELRVIINKVINDITCDKEIKKQVYNDIFKYMVVISRDYKMGETIGNFDENGQLSHYQLIDNSYYAIPSFKFVDDFIQGIIIDKVIVKDVLNNYIDEIKSSATNENGSLYILNRWWEAEDEEIEENTNMILTELEKNSYAFDLYPKILIYLIRIVKAGFSKDILENATRYMINNIESSSDYVSFGYRILDANLTQEEKAEYETIKSKLNETMENHNSLINKNGTQSVKDKQPGELGKYIHSWCSEHHSDLLNKKKFINEVGIDNIIYIVEKGNVCDVRFLIYLFNETYNYANVKELYPNDGPDLNKLLTDLKKIDVETFSKMKKYALDSLIEDVVDFINKLK